MSSSSLSLKELNLQPTSSTRHEGTHLSESPGPGSAFSFLYRLLTLTSSTIYSVWTIGTPNSGTLEQYGIWVLRISNKQNSCMEEKDSLFPAFRSLLCEGKKDLGCPIYPPPPHSWESWHSKKMARVLRNRSRWGLDLQEGKRKISHLSSKELKLSFCDYRVTSKESQENASQEFLTLNPKVTFKILTHPICITQERHLHRTYLWRSFAQLLHHTCSPTWAGLKMIPNLLLYFLPLQVRENLH